MSSEARENLLDSEPGGGVPELGGGLQECGGWRRPPRGAGRGGPGVAEGSGSHSGGGLRGGGEVPGAGCRHLGGWCVPPPGVVAGTLERPARGMDLRWRGCRLRRGCPGAAVDRPQGSPFPGCNWLRQAILCGGHPPGYATGGARLTEGADSRLPPGPRRCRLRGQESGGAGRHRRRPRPPRRGGPPGARFGKSSGPPARFRCR